MAATIEAKICEALLARVTTLFGGQYPIAFADVNFTPPVDASGKALVYLEASVAPNGMSYEPLSAGGTYRGMMQITVNYPVGSGSIKLMDVAGAIANGFDRGSRVIASGLSIDIYKRPVSIRLPPDGPYSRTAVTISYNASLI